MSVKPLLERVEGEVKDVLNTGFEFTGTTIVPNYDDAGLTYESGDTKKGKELETCVLYVDIRDSVKFNQKHQTKTMGRVYTAFIKAVLRAAAHHNGSVRNIIGDRVMIIFPPKHCFKNAVDCAVSINHISKKIINSNFGVNFKCGIGIDYGPIKVLKVGIERRGKENKDNKNLVWVGNPANIASRLTDVANKTFKKEYYEIQQNPWNMRRILGPLMGTGNSLSELLSGTAQSTKKEPLYLNRIETKKLSPEKFAGAISKYDHNNNLFYSGGKLIEFQKKSHQYKYQPILVTEEVYKGLKKEDSGRNSIKKNLWDEESRKIDNVESKIFGADLIWII